MKKKLVLKKETVAMLDEGMKNVRGGGEIRRSVDNLCTAAATVPTHCIISLHVCTA